MSEILEWEDAPILNDFMLRIGPIKRRKSAGQWIYGLSAHSNHRNGAGMMHGGAITAFIDEVAGTVAAERTGKRHVTIQAAITFVHPVREGEFIELKAGLTKVTRSMAFIETKLTVSNELVAFASLIFKAVPSAQPAGCEE